MTTGTVTLHRVLRTEDRADRVDRENTLHPFEFEIL